MHRFVERAAGETQAGGGNRSAEYVEHSHRHLEAAARRANQVGCRDAAMLEPEPRQRMRSDHPDAFEERQSRRIGGDDECGQAAGARRLAAPREDDIEVGNAAVGDPGLSSSCSRIESCAFGGRRDRGEGRRLGAGGRLGMVHRPGVTVLRRTAAGLCIVVGLFMLARALETKRRHFVLQECLKFLCCRRFVGRAAAEPNADLGQYWQSVMPF